jgi:predicted negative regulator of RcsB-dependent stress response
VDEYLSEKEQIQLIRGWWHENGAYIIAGLVIGVMGLTGWNYWQNFKTTRAENASVEYQSLVAAVDGGNREVAGSYLETLKTDYPMTPYLAQGRLMMARLSAEQNDLADAAEQLRAAIAETSDNELAQVARTRLARVLLAIDDTEGALSVLELSDAGVFSSRFHELRGDIFVHRGEMESAREEYGEALSSATAGVINIQEVQMKLDALAPALSVADEIIEDLPEETDADS